MNIFIVYNLFIETSQFVLNELKLKIDVFSPKSNQFPTRFRTKYNQMALQTQKMLSAVQCKREREKKKRKRQGQWHRSYVIRY